MFGESPQGMFSTFSLLPAREQFLSGCGPHFSFGLSKEKSPPQRWKRKPLRNELAPHGPTHPKRGAGRHKLPTKSRSLLPAALYLFRPELCPRTRKSAAHQCSKQDAPCPSFRCRSPVQLREGFPKGRDRSPAPLCHEGAWGTGGVPHVSGGGLRGRDLCAKGPFPLPRSGNCPLREQTVLSDFQIK